MVKQALVAAKNDDTFADLRKNTYGLVFFAVPHQAGHGASFGKNAKNIVISLTGNSKNDLIEWGREKSTPLALATVPKSDATRTSLLATCYQPSNDARGNGTPLPLSTPSP